jgi:putative RNA 2'-phosphotransferase
MTSKSELTSISKFISLVLRHEPERIGLSLDEAGWAPVDELLLKAAAAGREFSRDCLHEVVTTSDKQRFALSEDGQRIRANQGHSIEVELGLPAMTPPDVLYHGTATRFADLILRSGLDRRARHHVHLTESLDTATAVGRRYGIALILRIDARRMAERGHAFCRSDNGVWLVDHVPAEFLKAMQ